MTKTNDTTTWTVAEYTAQYDDAIRPVAEPEAGDRVRFPEDPQGTGCTADGREADAFRRRCHEAGVCQGHYIDTEDGWDIYSIVRAEDWDEDCYGDDPMDQDGGAL